jgi:hypothetical protein
VKESAGHIGIEKHTAEQFLGGVSATVYMIGSANYKDCQD